MFAPGVASRASDWRPCNLTARQVQDQATPSVSVDLHFQDADRIMILDELASKLAAWTLCRQALIQHDLGWS